MPRISALPPLTTPAPDDEVPIHDKSAGTTKKIALSDLTGYPTLGWVAAGQTWTYASWDATNHTAVITVPTDATTKYSLRYKIQITQATGGTKYGVVTAVSATTLTVFFNTDYTFTNETISSPMYSPERTPFGFPSSDLSKWTVTATSSSAAALPTGGAFGAVPSLTLSIPIGSWRVFGAANFEATRSGGSGVAGIIGLSTSTSSITYQDSCFHNFSRASAATYGCGGGVLNPTDVVLTAATNHYIVFTGTLDGGTWVTAGGGTTLRHSIRAVCAYI